MTDVRSNVFAMSILHCSRDSNVPRGTIGCNLRRLGPGESQKSLVDRITLYLRRWVEMSGLEMTVEGD